MTKSLWKKNDVEKIFNLPLIELIFEAQKIHRKHFNADEIELCSILSVKTGACPEDCGYCTQSGHYKTTVEKEKLIGLDKVIAEAIAAKANGAVRFCVGAAWRNPPKKDFPKILDMISQIKSLGLETCATLGMLDAEQAKALKNAGLDFYNHNLDTSPSHYPNIVTTHTYEDRLDTLEKVRNADIKVCCGGILGMGESREDRIDFLLQLANLPKPPESVPINKLIPMAGTPLEQSPQIENFEFIRTIAAARIMMPTSMIRLSGGRENMSEETQTLCFMAGANSIWLGNKLLTANNRKTDQDSQLLNTLGLKAKQPAQTLHAS